MAAGNAFSAAQALQNAKSGSIFGSMHGGATLNRRSGVAALPSSAASSAAAASAKPVPSTRELLMSHLSLNAASDIIPQSPSDLQVCALK